MNQPMLNISFRASCLAEIFNPSGELVLSHMEFHDLFYQDFLYRYVLLTTEFSIKVLYKLD